MKEQRRAFRVSTVGRIALRVVDEHEENQARLAVGARSVPDMSGALGIEESIGTEERAQLKLLDRMACYLNRIDRRLEELCQLQREDRSGLPTFSDPIALTLSAVGLSGPLDLSAESGTLVELTLDLLDNSLPLIPAVASVVRSPGADAEAKSGRTALHFEEMTDMDRERIVRFATRIQRESLRRDRKEFQ